MTFPQTMGTWGFGSVYLCWIWADVVSPAQCCCRQCPACALQRLKKFHFSLLIAGEQKRRTTMHWGRLSFFCQRKKLRPSHLPKSFCPPPHFSTDQGLNPHKANLRSSKKRALSWAGRIHLGKCTSSLQLSECHIRQSASSHPCAEQKETVEYHVLLWWRACFLT